MPIEHEPDLKGFHDIKADKDLKERTVKEIVSKSSQSNSPVDKMAAKDNSRYIKNGSFKRIVSLAASFLLVVGAIAIYSFDPFNLKSDRTPDSNISDYTQVPDNSKPNNGDNSGAGQNTPGKDTAPLDTAGDSGLEIPALQLPENTNGASYDMIGLFVYNGKIYTQTGTEIDAENGKKLLGDKLGTTKGNIDEWSKQDEYAVEFASSIGEMEVYTAKGYDKDFRLMTYNVYDDGAYAQFYECLNGITIHSGQDVFGKLKIEGNITKAYYRSYYDWNNGIENYKPIEDAELYNNFAKELNNTIPYSYESAEIDEYRNNGDYRELKLELKDGSIVQLALYKNGFIRYGYSDFFMKMEHEVFQKLWDQMAV